MLPSLRSKDINAQREKISLGLKLRILRYIYIHNIKQCINAQKFHKQYKYTVKLNYV